MLVPNQLIYLTNQDETDPAKNLALEEYALRQLPADKDYLLLYLNRSSVIVGKNQNIVEEANQRFCALNDIPILRRISGGGSVYHDPGNLNFCFITEHTLKNFNNYQKFIKPILHILKQRDPAIGLDEANNLVLNGLKISGNAQFTTKGRLLSHGTLLFNVDKNRLRKSLERDPSVQVRSRSSKSRRAEITNLSDFPAFKNYDIPQFINDLRTHLFGQNVKALSVPDVDKQSINKLATEKYGNWEWNFGLSPACVIEKYALKIEINKGRITQIDGDEKGAFQQFIGQKYDFRALIDTGVFSMDLVEQLF